PLLVADLGVERDPLPAGQLALLAVLEEEAPGDARVGLRAGVDVEGLLPVAVLRPLADDVAAADDEQLVGAFDGGAELPGLVELVPVDAPDLADLGLLRGVGNAAVGQQRAP